MMGNTNSSQTVDEHDTEPPSNTPRCRASMNDQRVDQFTLIWLDESSKKDSLDSLHTRTLLTQINTGHCLFLDRTDLFLSEIERLKSENQKILVVVSGLFAREIVSKTKDSVSTIIIFCREPMKYINLTGNNSNVAHICTEHETLKSCIERELPSLKFNLFSNQKLNSLRTLATSQEVGNSSAYFSYMLFIDLLKQMPPTKQAKEIMLNKCKDYYRQDPSELVRIELFENTYTPKAAINWYTKDSFVYRLVNQAFKTEDIALWYLFRFYIIDLCAQLENVHKEQNIHSSILKLYRGQAHLPTKELDNLKANINGLISTNGFFSTSTNSDLAKVFMTDAKDSDDFKVVFFEITVDTDRLQNTIFVDVEKYMKTIGEGEILFNIGSVFKIKSVNDDPTLKAWKIEMEATDEGTNAIKDRINTMRKKFENFNINMLFGRLLLDMGEFAKAESYFQMMLQVLRNSYKDLASVYDHIGDLHMQTTNWKEALKNFNSAYEIKKKKLRPNIGTTLNSIGNYYKAIGDNVQALKYYEKALQCKNVGHNSAITQINIGAIHMNNKDYGQAMKLCNEAHDILHKTNPSPHAAIIHCYGVLGDIHLGLYDYNIAESLYFTAFEMCKRFLFTDDRCRVSCIKALASLYHKQGMNQRAIIFCLEQLSFFEQHLSENHISVAYLLMKIAELSEDDEDQKINSLKRALCILQENIYRGYATTASCLTMIAECYQKQKRNREASAHYIKAIDIQRKILPEDHSLIIKTQSFIDAIEKLL